MAKTLVKSQQSKSKFKRSERTVRLVRVCKTNSSQREHIYPLLSWLGHPRGVVVWQLEEVLHARYVRLALPFAPTHQAIQLVWKKSAANVIACYFLRQLSVLAHPCQRQLSVLAHPCQRQLPVLAHPCQRQGLTTQAAMFKWVSIDY